MRIAKFVLITILGLTVNLSWAGGEMKKVCMEDAKTKKEICKTVKVHKKLDGTKPPEKK